MNTPSTVKTQIQSLIDRANEVTGGSDINLTSAVGSLINGYTDWFPYMVCLYNTFNGATFPDNTDLVINLGTKTIASINNQILNQSFFNSSGLRSLKISTPTKGFNTYASNSFNNCTTLEVVDLSECEPVFFTFVQVFYKCEKLKSIYGKLDVSSVTVFTNVFYNCYALEDVEFVEGSIHYDIDFKYSSLLSDVSIQSIVDGLADLTGSDAQTLTVHADVEARMTEEQKATITAKNWELKTE